VDKPSRRLDAALVKLGLYSGRGQAAEAIRKGRVSVDGAVVLKPSFSVNETAVIEAAPQEYVGRGGHKLAAALDAFDIDVSGLTALDIGASTGGFTQCLLLRGAAKVYAVDVGRDQLHPSLKADPRVISMEGTDIRACRTGTEFPAVDIITADLSFIPLAQVIPHIAGFLKDAGRAVCLVKPQYQAGREHVGKGGVVRNPAAHGLALERVRDAAARCGLRELGAMPSPVVGGDGNKEFLLYLTKG